MSFSNPVTGGQGALVRPAIKSPNYVAGTSGWTIKRDGSAEFNNLTIRGAFDGQNFVINSSGIFLYSGTPAAGNMSGSWAPAAGTDTYGNAYPAGLKLYSALGNIHLDSGDGVFRSTGSSGALVSITDGQISFQNSGDWSNAFILQNFLELNGSLHLQSGLTNVAGLSTLLHIVSTAGAVTPGNQDTYPRTVTTGSGGVVGNHYVSGALIKSSADGLTGETWQTPGVIANWSNVALKCRLDGQDQVKWAGRVDYTGAGLAGPGSATILSSAMAAKFRPKVNWNPGGVAQYLAAGTFKAPAAVAVRADGNLSILYGSGGVATNDRFEFSISVPLGNIS